VNGSPAGATGPGRPSELENGQHEGVMIQGAFPPRFSEAEFARRHRLARELMDDLLLDGLVIFGSSAEARMQQADVYWLSNFAGIRENYLLFPMSGEPVLFVQTHNHVPQARQLSIVPVEPGGGAGTWSDVGDRVGEQLRARGLRSVGLVGLVPYQAHARMAATSPASAFRDVTREFRSLRVTKSEEELEWLRRGAAYTDAAHQALEHKARPGLREYELMEVILSAYPCALAEAQVAFLGSTSMREPDRCVPAQFPSSRRVAEGDLFFTELSIAFGGYGGQSLRTFTFGRPSALVDRMHELALELFEAVRAALRPGATAEEILEIGDLAGRHSFGMVDALLHGWGIGVLPPVLRSRSRPWATTGNSWTFAENQTVVVQPNVVTPDERLGVQVGDLCVVTAEGARPLHSFRRELIVCA
jgi:Xaa-Pro dipeptidase